MRSKTGMIRKTVYVHEETYQKAMKFLKHRNLTVSKYLQLALLEFVQSVEESPVQDRPIANLTVEEFLEYTRFWMEKLKE